MVTLAEFTFHQLLAVPGSRGGHENGDRGRGAAESVDPAVFAALVAAHAELLGTEDAAFAFAWERLPNSDTLRFVVGGAPYSPVADSNSPPDDVVSVMYPPGSRGRRLAGGQVVGDWASLRAWVSCDARFDPLWLPSDGWRPPKRGAFEDYVTHLPGPFVWLVTARPVSRAAVEAELAQMEVRLPRMRSRENSEPDRIALPAAEYRYREFTRSLASGLWEVRVLIGAVDSSAAVRAAGMLCSAGDIDGLPYVLIPDHSARSWSQAWTARAGLRAGGELLAALARPPNREMPGIRLPEPPRFDVTPEQPVDVERSVILGTVLDSADRGVGALRVGTDTLNRHTFVAGATGSGKSQTVRHLLEQLAGSGVPWLVIEPAKAEYAGMAGRIGTPVTVIRPGDPDAVSVGLNPLEPESGFPIQTHIDLVRALFLAAFDAVEPFPQVLAHALNNSYYRLGWDAITGESRIPGVTPRFPSLGDLRAEALEVVEGIGYGREITDNVRGFIDVRIGALRLGTPGRFFDGGRRLDVADLMRRHVVLEIEDVGNDSDKAFFIGVVLIRIVEHLRLRRAHRQPGLRHVLVVEEAHRLLKRTQPGTSAAHAVELFAALLAEIRAYGEGVIVAEQIPTKILPDVVKNTSLKIMHRLPARDDREVVGAAMNLDEAQSRHVVSLPPGHAVVFADGMDRPIRLIVPLGEARETPLLATREVALQPERSITGPVLALRDVHRAHRIAEDPRLVLWIELLLVAHLVGRPPPQPDRGWLTSLTARFAEPLLDEAIVELIRRGVDGRYGGLIVHYQPEQLTDHLAGHVRRARTATDVACGGDTTYWQAGRFRWADVENALHDTTVPADRPHPDTDTWVRRGLMLPGSTIAEQLDALHAHPDSWSPDPRVILGPHTPVVLVATIDQLSCAHPGTARLAEATRHLTAMPTWPMALLDNGDRAETS